MSGIEQMTKAWQSAMPAEFVGAVNLMAHPIAGAAAAGALGLGLASHAFGLWVGAAVGAAEVSHRMLAGVSEAEARPKAAKPVKRVPVEPVPAPEVVTPPEAAAVPEKAAEPVAADPEPEAEAEAAAAVAASAQPAGIGKPAAPDDLKAISGIGPKLEKVLNDLGIWTYGQIAALSGPEIAWLDDRLGFSGRIGRDDWVGQAKSLAGKAEG